jgi:hypothetical protein
MDVSKIQQLQIREYNLEQVKIQKKREDDYRKLIEKRNFDQIVADRVERNIRLDSDKGRNVDIET